MSLLRFALLLCCIPALSATASSPYLSPNTLFTNYHKMLQTLKIFIYTPPDVASLTFTSRTEALFVSLLINSSFVTPDPEEAHLFFIPLPFSAFSKRSTARAIAELRSHFPYWNRTLGADHFLVSCTGLSQANNRNFLELKKNSVLVSCFPTPPGNFIPHKDITLPPHSEVPLPHAPVAEPGIYLGYVRHGWVRDANLVKTLTGDAEILIESEPSDQLTYEERLSESKFCVFEYGDGAVSGISDAVRLGCVPVVITDRPIQDAPLMDVLMWQEMALFVGSSGVVHELRGILSRTTEGRYGEMKGSCETAGEHFAWNKKPQPYDAFHMVMYQLWLRRHTIRYVQRNWL